MIYGKVSLTYLKYNIPTIPVSGKAPVIKGWSKYCGELPEEEQTEEWSKKFPNNNIGICLGEASGLVALDIDTDDPATLKALPYSPVVKRGKKGETRFFSFNGEIAQKFGKIEILSTGNQTVIPPSIHPDTKTAYIWTKCIPIQEWENLPTLDMEAVKKVVGNVREVHHEGRNSTMVKHFTAKISDGIDPTTAISEAIEYDKENHTPPLFEDKKEGSKTGLPHIEATIFYANVFKSLSRNIVIPPHSILKVEVNEFTMKKVERPRLPKLRGIAQDMFSFIYDSSHVPRSRYAFASAISTMGGLLANKVMYDNTYTNFYSLIVGDSGTGKNNPLKFPYRLFRAAELTHLLGIEEIGSHNSVLLSLSDRPTRIDVVDEAATLFSAAGSSEGYLSRVGDVYTKLFSSTGDYYRGMTLGKYLGKDNPDGTIGAVENPCIGLFAAMTPRDVENHLTHNLVEKGLGGRFLYFMEDKYKKSITPKVNSRVIPKELIEQAKAYQNLKPSHIDLDKGSPAIALGLNMSATNKKREYKEVIEALKKEWKSSIVAPYTNRMEESLTKLMIIDHMSVSPPGKLEIETSSVDWAIKTTEVLFGFAKHILLERTSENQFQKTVNTIVRIITNKGGKIRRVDLLKEASQYSNKQVDMVLKNLVEREMAVEFLDDRRKAIALQEQVTESFKRNDTIDFI